MQGEVGDPPANRKTLLGKPLAVGFGTQSKQQISNKSQHQEKHGKTWFKTYTSKNQLGLPTLHHGLMDALISPSLVVFQCLATWSWRSLFHMLTKGPQKQLNVLKSAMAMFQKNLLLFSIFQIDQNIMQTKGGINWNLELCNQTPVYTSAKNHSS